MTFGQLVILMVAIFVLIFCIVDRVCDCVEIYVSVKYCSDSKTTLLEKRKLKNDKQL
jgi:hypothetical protein